MFLVQMLNQRDALYNGTMTPMGPGLDSTTPNSKQE